MENFNELIKDLLQFNKYSQNIRPSSLQKYFTTDEYAKMNQMMDEIVKMKKELDEFQKTEEAKYNVVYGNDKIMELLNDLQAYELLVVFKHLQHLKLNITDFGLIIGGTHRTLLRWNLLTQSNNMYYHGINPELFDYEDDKIVLKQCTYHAMKLNQDNKFYQKYKFICVEYAPNVFEDLRFLNFGDFRFKIDGDSTLDVFKSHFDVYSDDSMFIIAGGRIKENFDQYLLISKYLSFYKFNMYSLQCDNIKTINSKSISIDNMSNCVVFCKSNINDIQLDIECEENDEDNEIYYVRYDQTLTHDNCDNYKIDMVKYIKSKRDSVTWYNDIVSDDDDEELVGSIYKYNDYDDKIKAFLLKERNDAHDKMNNANAIDKQSFEDDYNIKHNAYVRFIELLSAVQNGITGI